MTNEDRTRAIAWFEKQSKCLAMPGAAKMFGLAAEALNEGRWIPVSEGLPEHEREAALAYQRDFNEAHIAWISGGYWEDTSGTFAPGKITHWMSLPKPPKGE